MKKDTFSFSLSTYNNYICDAAAMLRSNDRTFDGILKLQRYWLVPGSVTFLCKIVKV